MRTCICNGLHVGGGGWGGGGVHRLAPICCNTSMKRLQVKGGQNHAVSVEPAIVVTWDVQRSTKSSSGTVLIVILLYM